MGSATSSTLLESVDDHDHARDEYAPVIEPEWVMNFDTTNDPHDLLVGERLVVPEWNEKAEYRHYKGWQVRKYTPGRDTVPHYFVHYGAGDGIPNLKRGGVGTVLTGIVLFTPASESHHHKSRCHGGSICAVLVDAIVWCSFVVTGDCRPWTGETVRVRMKHGKPIQGKTILIAKATVTKVQVEKRKVYMNVELIDPSQDNAVHASGEGIAILNEDFVRALDNNEANKPHCTPRDDKRDLYAFPLPLISTGYPQNF